MVLDYQSVNKHLEIMREYVADLLSYRREFTKDRLISDRKAQHLALYALQMEIHSCIDIGSHIVADLALRRPEENSEIFRILAEKKILPAEFSKSLVKMVKFRNQLVHVYWKVDMEQVHEILHERLEDFNKFEKYILKFLEKGR